MGKGEVIRTNKIFATIEEIVNWVEIKRPGAELSILGHPLEMFVGKWRAVLEARKDIEVHYGHWEPPGHVTFVKTEKGYKLIGQVIFVKIKGNCSRPIRLY